jgi:hypothetical protein
VKPPLGVEKGVAIEHASVRPSGDALRLKTDQELGTLTVRVLANGTALLEVSADFSKAALLGLLPKLEENTLVPRIWRPAGGEDATITIVNGGTSGAIVVAPQGMPLLPKQSLRMPNGFFLA